MEQVADPRPHALNVVLQFVESCAHRREFGPRHGDDLILRRPRIVRSGLSRSGLPT